MQIADEGLKPKLKTIGSSEEVCGPDGCTFLITGALKGGTGINQREMKTGRSGGRAGPFIEGNTESLSTASELT